MKKLLIIIKERKIYYIIVYFISYALSLIIDGAPSLIYYFPIKLFPIAMAIGLGNALYYVKPNMSMCESHKLGFKYGLVILILVFIGLGIQYFCDMIGVDITPFLGFPRGTNLV